MRMPFKEVLVCVQLLLLFLCVLMFVASVEADYTFTVRFYEFRNPLGLQCGECESGGPPACCDDLQRRENCTNMPPKICGTRFRFMLRLFGASVESAPNTGFPYFTPGGFDNSRVFTEGPQAFLALPNPFVITRMGEWIGKTQFFIDSLDRASNVEEIEAIINRFPIDLELNPGSSFTERTTYTGIYNISGLGFDMSFRVQCSENYYGADCNTFCEPVEGVYTCDSEGRVVCVQENGDPATQCTTCLQGWDLETDCRTCSPFYDDKSSCSQCLAGRDMDTNCATCLPGYDPSTNCSQCLPGVQYQMTQEPSQTVEVTGALTSPASVGGNNSNLIAVGGAVGGAAVLLIIILLILCLIIVIMALQLKRQRKMTFPGAVVSADNPAFARGPSVKERTETARLGEHDFENPLYGAKQDNNSMPNNYADYSKLQRPPLQKPFVPQKFPYTVEHNEEAAYQLDVAGKATYDVTNDGNPPYDVAYPPPANENGGSYDVTHHPSSYVPEPSASALAGGIYNLANYPEEQVVYDVADHPPQQESARYSPNDYADIADVPDSTTAEPHHAYDYADIADTPGPSSAPHYDYPDTVPMSSPPPPPGHLSHEYADAEVPRPSELTSMSATYYANTTPGEVTPEAMDHYDLGQ